MILWVRCFCLGGIPESKIVSESGKAIVINNTVLIILSFSRFVYPSPLFGHKYTHFMV